MLAGLFLLVSCGKAPITGEWVQPIPGMEDQMQGIKLEDGGKAESINMSTLLYQSWKQEGNKLTLTGESIGNGQTIDFEEVYIVAKLTKDSLVLKQGNLELVYVREEK